MSPTTRTTRSLKTQYTIFTALFGVVIIGVSILIYINILNNSKKVASEVAAIDAQAVMIKGIRSDLVRLQFSIDSYLLDPTKTDLQQSILDRISSSSQTASLMLKSAREGLFINKIRKMQSDLGSLDSYVRELIDIRVDVLRQYPGMALSAFQMSSIQDDVQAHLSILLGEIESGVFEPESAELYPLLLKTRTAWVSQVSQMRIYLANRLASFSNDVLVLQARSVIDINATLQENLQKLEVLYNDEPDSFEGMSSIKGLEDNFALWLVKFNEMRAKSESPQWRQDWNLMESSIIPLQQKISGELNELEDMLRMNERSVNEQRDENTNTMFMLVAFIMVAGVVLILLMILSINLLIFNPIKMLTEALRARAFGQEVPSLVIRHSEETQLLVEAFEEMDHQVTQRQNALEHQSFHDVLTSLPNRIMLNDRLKYIISRARQAEKNFVVLVVGIENFPDVTDALGHQLADKLILQLATRLKEKVSDSDTLARIGTDEFAIVISSTTCDDCSKFADDMFDDLSRTYDLAGHRLSLNLHGGVAMYPQDSENGRQLLQKANIAMNYARRNHIKIAKYDVNNDEQNINKLAIIEDLRKAIKNNRLEMYFQPQVSLQEKRVSGAEALLRWNHPERGFIRPDKIIELANQGAMQNELCMWVIDTSFKSAGQWHRAGYDITISINLAVESLEYAALCDSIRERLDFWQLDPSRVVFEITESGMMNNPGRSIEVLNRLHEMGVKLSIDDFGTGFSSLSYLQMLPVDEVKIDRSFVMNMDENKGDQAIVESVIDLGHNLDLCVVAEGIETNRILHTLAKMKCDYAQGFLISKAKPQSEFFEWLEQNSIIENDFFVEHRSGG